MLTPIIYYLLSAGGLSTLFYFLVKTAISKSFDFGIEKYKTTLNMELESHKQRLLLDTEKFKSDLNLISIEHNIAFGKLQGDRAEVIKNAYSKLIDLQKKLYHLTTMLQGPDWHINKERDEEALKSLDDFKDYIVVNRIFLPKDVCSQILIIIDKSWNIIIDMSSTKEEAKSNIQMGGKTSRELWRELNKKVTVDIDKAATELEDSFRKLLGDK